MSGSGIGFRVSALPESVRKMIQNIKEIARNHGDEEIYAMLKECAMDPNETAQKLLLQDTFHEVKKKRDRKKEKLNIRETANSRWRPGPPGRAGRGGQGNYSSRHTADAGGGKHFVSTAENGVNQAPENAISKLPAPIVKEVKIKEKDLAKASGGNGNECTSQISSMTNEKRSEVPLAGKSYCGTTKKNSVESEAGMVGGDGQPQPGSNKNSVPVAGISSGQPLASDPVVVWSSEPRAPGVIGAVKHEIGSQCTPVEANSDSAAESKLHSAHGIRSSFSHAKMSSKSQGAGKSQLSDSSRPSSSSGHGGPSSSSSRPSSNYGSRSQHVIGPHKGPSKEWKPKTTNSNNILVSGSSPTSQQCSTAAEKDEQVHAVNGNVSSSDKDVSKFEKELDGLQIKDAQHVIIPNHIHVPESVKTGLSFGSFDAAFMINSGHGNNSKPEKRSEHVPVVYQAVEDSAAEPAVSNDNVAVPSAEQESVDLPQSSARISAEEESVDLPRSSARIPENSSSDNADLAPSSVSDFGNSKEKTGSTQHPAGHTSSVHSFPSVSAPVLGNVASYDSSDNQARDAPRVPNFVVHQPIDPASASFYAQFYQSGEGDGRISPGVPNYNGNAALLPSQTSESPQEGGIPVALSTTARGGVLPGNMTVAQQGVPLFRQPPGLPMTHYHPNYFPYGQFIPPFYVPNPAIHQYFGNNAFLQQAQGGSVYPGPPTGAAAGVKYSLPQFKPANNSGNLTHVGVAGGYGPYGSSPGYHTGSAAGNMANNEELAGSQYKENSAYSTGQQTEGSAVWIAGRDISALQANSFYNLPQGQHVTFPPSQAGHGSFAGVYHPSQAVTAANVHHPLLQQSQGMPGAGDMVGAPPSSVYQQSQHATQVNWPNNY